MAHAPTDGGVTRDEGDTVTDRRVQWVAPGPAARSSLGSVVVETLVDQIVSGQLAVGAVLPSEAELGGQLGVSRTVVRESVKALQSKGLLSSRQGVGTVVRDMTDWDLIDQAVLSAVVRHDATLAILDDLVTVRAALETTMAEQACARHQPGQTAQVRAAFDLMAATMAEPEAFGRADVEFHDAVMVLSANRLGRAIVTSIHEQARTTGRYHGKASRPNREFALAEHQAILEALERGDGAAAGKAMRDHVLGAWERRRPSTTAPAIG